MEAEPDPDRTLRAVVELAAPVLLNDRLESGVRVRPHGAFSSVVPTQSNGRDDQA
jgi:hypothetical protein